MPTINLYTTWQRPTLMIFSASAPAAVTASVAQWNILGTAGTDYIFLTDDNRSDVAVSIDRIEHRKRMINGTMRTYHVADKKSFSCTWTDVPSSKSFLSEVRKNSNPSSAFAAGQDVLSWYENHTEDFWMMLVYDTPDPVKTGNVSVPVRFKIETYNVFFDSFDYNIKKRALDHDIWDMSVSLVEV